MFELFRVVFSAHETSVFVAWPIWALVVLLGLALFFHSASVLSRLLGGRHV